MANTGERYTTARRSLIDDVAKWKFFWAAWLEALDSPALISDRAAETQAELRFTGGQA